MKRIITTSVLCLTIGFVAAACGGSDDTASTAKTEAAGQQQAGAGRSPGGSGEVVDVSGSTAQVKGSDSQVAVTWTDSTTFTKQVAGSASDIAVGSCVMVTPADATSTSTDTVAAGSVRITEATDGECSMGGGMGGGTPPGGGGTPPGDGERGDAPSGERPTDMPSGAPGGQGGGGRGGFAVGEVTAVTDAGFTVSAQQPGADAKATTVEVTTSDATTYTMSAKASADDVVVGVCVTSRGKADDTGAITATTISVAEQVDGACSTGGFGGGRPDGAPGAANDEA